MSAHFAFQDMPEQARDRDEVDGGARLPAEWLPPLLAGARARGIADAFELLGKAAVLLDGSGMALHVNSIAKGFMGSTIAITRRHLIGADAEANSALQVLIGEAIAGRAHPGVALSRKDQGPLFIQALPIAGAAEDPQQILKAVVTISD
jgi:hypothetical protein